MNPNEHDHDQINSGLRAVLALPFVYLLFQRLMGSHLKYRMYVNDFLIPSKGMRILDIGCGCSEILCFLPENIQYVGYDLSARYIEYARGKYGHRAEFHNQRVNDMSLNETGSFDIVIADGLLHHLNDIEAGDLFRIGSNVLKDNGFMFTADPTLVQGQKFLDKFITSNDRGQHVRSPEAYRRIAETKFSHIEATVVKNVGLFSLTGCYMKCYKNDI